MATPTKREVHHPLFARMYRRMAAEFENKGVSEHRDELLTRLSGRVIEVGAGTGLNFAHYPGRRGRGGRGRTRVLSPRCRRRGGGDRARQRDRRRRHRRRTPREFDAGVASLVLCSVPNQASALAELHRVIRPGGELRFYEHVRSTSPGLGRAQRVLDVVWPRFGGGCHTSRDTEDAMTDAGFDVELLRRFTFRPAIIATPVSPIIIGAARRP